MSIDFLGWAFVACLVLWLLISHEFKLGVWLPAGILGSIHSTFIGFTHDLVYDEGGLNARLDAYLERWILWLPWFERYRDEGGSIPSSACWRYRLTAVTLRLHKFHRGDDDSAPHDHPWWFVTFPLQSYSEVWWDPVRGHLRSRIVKAFRFHYRPSAHRHYVVLPAHVAPSYTLVLTGPWERRWGFWPRPDTYVYYRDWMARKREGQNPVTGEPLR